MPHITHDQLERLRGALRDGATTGERAEARQLLDTIEREAAQPDIPLMQAFAQHPKDLGLEQARAALYAVQRLLLHSSLGLLATRMPPSCGVVGLANATAARLFGTTPGALQRLTITELLDISEEELEAAVQQAAEQGKSRYLELATRGASGEMQWAGCNIHAMHRAGELVGALVVVRDITRQVQTQQRLGESLKLLDALEEASPQALCIIDDRGRYVLVNRAYCELFGYSREELMGEHYMLVVPPEHAALFKRASAAGTPEAYADGEWPLMRRGGQVFAAWVKMTTFEADGRRLRVSSVQDMTERKQQEAMWAKLDARIAQSQKLESLGLLAGGIAHDFNNLLAGVQSSIDALGAPGCSPQDAAELLEDMREATRGACDLVRTLISYAGQRPAQRRACDLGKLVEDTLRLLRSSHKRALLCEVKLPEQPLVAQAEPSQLQQVLLNLLLNAQEASGHNAQQIEVRLAERVVGSESLVDAITGTSVKAGCWAMIAVRDFGVGVPLEYQQRIFDPFFTTKETGRGLGLASAAGIVRAHGGAMLMRSEPGAGTTFELLLPLE